MPRRLRVGETLLCGGLLPSDWPHVVEHLPCSLKSVQAKAAAVGLDAVVLPLYDVLMPKISRFLATLTNRRYCHIKGP